MQVELAVKVLSSLRDYYNLIKSDSTRMGVLIKKVLLESCCGEEIKSSNLVKDLSSFLGARRGTVLECFQSRSEMQKVTELKPVVDRLARKSITGNHKISPEWEIKVAGWYETESVSEIVKGHHNIFKVRNLIQNKLYY